jgi:hypothetical protein
MIVIFHTPLRILVHYPVFVALGCSQIISFPREINEVSLPHKQQVK